jgi:hypothetical protein
MWRREKLPGPAGNRTPDPGFIIITWYAPFSTLSTKESLPIVLPQTEVLRI